MSALAPRAGFGGRLRPASGEVGAPSMPSLVNDLARVDSYPPPCPSSVQVVTTHASWVFLTDTEAWKVKRPVDYGFLDFTTAEKRRRFCEEEVGLNRRLAPGVYLSVESVRRDGRGHSFARPGEVVDWAVRMRRLPDSARALEMLRQGALGHEHLGALAHRLARFYAAVPSHPSFGRPDAVAANVEENFAQVEPFVGRFVGEGHFRRTRDWQRSFLLRERGALEDRSAGGRSREGHGDLRLEHVYFVDGRPLIIDCIDFNERFRNCDVASDVAFLAMDLMYRGRPDLGAWFLCRFALESNDYGLFSVIDFYLSYRAWVRGKVACFVADDPATPYAKRERKAEEARRHFALALACTGPPLEPARVVAVGGLIGTGKSSIAEALSRETGFPVVSADATRKHLAGLWPTDHGDEDIYTPSFTRLTTQEVFRRAETVLRSGRGVILDSTFRSRRWRLEAWDLARSRGLPFRFVEARCQEAVARARLRQRSGTPSISDAGPELYDAFRLSFEPVSELEPTEHIVVDTDQPQAVTLRGVLDRIRA